VVRAPAAGLARRRGRAGRGWAGLGGGARGRSARRDAEPAPRADLAARHGSLTGVCLRAARRVRVRGGGVPEQVSRLVMDLSDGVSNQEFVRMHTLIYKLCTIPQVPHCLRAARPPPSSRRLACAWRALCAARVCPWGECGWACLRVGGASTQRREFVLAPGAHVTVWRAGARARMRARRLPGHSPRPATSTLDCRSSSCASAVTWPRSCSQATTSSVGMLLRAA